ncbi:MAG: hypothetical protein ABIO43_06895 [Sphingomicrobium sp.]
MIAFAAMLLAVIEQPKDLAIPDLTSNGFYTSDVLAARRELTETFKAIDSEYVEQNGFVLWQIWARPPSVKDDLRRACAILKEHWLGSGVVDVRFSTAVKGNKDDLDGQTTSLGRMNCASGLVYKH